MDITIGIRNLAREVKLESTLSADEAQEAVTAALSNGTALVLTDERGRRVVVPAEALGYVSIGGDEPRRVGFGAIAPH